MRSAGSGGGARSGVVTRPGCPCSCSGGSALAPGAAHRGSGREAPAAAGRSPRGGARSCSGAWVPFGILPSPAAQVRPRPAPPRAPPFGPVPVDSSCGLAARRPSPARPAAAPNLGGCPRPLRALFRRRPLPRYLCGAGLLGVRGAGKVQVKAVPTP